MMIMLRPQQKALLLFIFALLSLAPAAIEMRPQQTQDYDRTFKSLTAQLLGRLPQVASRKPYRLKKFNASVQSMGQAAMVMAQGGDLRLAESYLDESLNHYDGNSTALLLKGILADAAGSEMKANEFFDAYLLHSRNFSDFERAFLRWDEFHKLRRSVYDLLTARGMDFQGREADIRVREPLKTLARYLMHPAEEDKLFNLLFAMVTIGGGVMLLALVILGVDFSTAPMKILTGLYGVFWVCYVLWLWDIAFGLPFQASRFTLIPLLLTASTSLLIALEVFRHWRERNAPPQPGHRRCPKCRRELPQLMTECPHCRSRVEEGT